MADKKKGKLRKLEEEKPTKEEYAVAKYLRFNLPVRKGKLHGMEVKCFYGNAAVDKLLESKWSNSGNPSEYLFHNRGACVAYLVRLLRKGLFHRAEREKRKKDKDKEKDRSKRRKKDKEGEKEETNPPEEELRKRKGKKDRKTKKEKEAEAAVEDEAEKKGEDGKKCEKKDEKKKKEKRLKLVMPDEQFFEDGEEVFVWIYDPVNAKTFLIGLLMVLGAIALCMFPLWPEEVRIGVYYLSLAAAGFVGFILSLVVVRLILFCFIWLLTFGKHHFWFLPNLTEDVGFFDSFRPLYKHEAISKSDDSKSGDGGKKKKSEKEETGSPRAIMEKKEKSNDKDDSDEFELIKKEDLDQNGANEDNEDVTESNENDYDDNEGEDRDQEDEEEEDNIGDENGDTEEEDEEEEEEEEAEEEEESHQETPIGSGKKDSKKTK